jgi:hypothetical protein
MEENKSNKKIKYKDMVYRMKKAHQKNQLKSNTNTPDSQARQDKIQDLNDNLSSNLLQILPIPKERRNLFALAITK